VSVSRLEDWPEDNFERECHKVDERLKKLNGRAPAIASAVADGELTPMEAAELSKVLDCYTRAVETADLAARLVRLEQRGRNREITGMRTIESRLRKLEQVVTPKPIASVWLDQQNEAELRPEIAERQAKGFRVVVSSWDNSD
jgi:hypothetical protein